MALSMSVLSTQEVIVPVSAISPSGPIDPSSDPLAFAFVSVGAEPGSGDWVTGTWGGQLNGMYWAQCLVGPAAGVSGTVLSIGSYAIWYKITDNPEVPVQQAGVLTITP